MPIPDSLEDILALPLETLFLIAAGYLSYRMAYTGKDASHQAVDTVFLTAVFALVAKGAMVLIAEHYPAVGPIFGGCLAVVAALASSAIWRTTGEPLTGWLLRTTGISASDRHKTAWLSMTAGRGYQPTDILVVKKDGSEAECKRLADFCDAPLNELILGEDGSVALFVTGTRTPGGKWESEEPFDPAYADWGYRMTFIPAEEIREVRISFVESTTGFGAWIRRRLRRLRLLARPGDGT